MPAWFMAVLFGGLAAAAIYGLRRDFVTGVASDDLYRSNRNEQPTGFAAIVAGKLLVVAFGAAEIAHALGLMDDPLLMLRRLFG